MLPPAVTCPLVLYDSDGCGEQCYYLAAKTDWSLEVATDRPLACDCKTLDLGDKKLLRDLAMQRTLFCSRITLESGKFDFLLASGIEHMESVPDTIGIQTEHSSCCNQEDEDPEKKANKHPADDSDEQTARPPRGPSSILT